MVGFHKPLLTLYEHNLVGQVPGVGSAAKCTATPVTGKLTGNIGSVNGGGNWEIPCQSTTTQRAYVQRTSYPVTRAQIIDLTPQVLMNIRLCGPPIREGQRPSPTPVPQ